MVRYRALVHRGHSEWSIANDSCKYLTVSGDYFRSISLVLRLDNPGRDLRTGDNGCGPQFPNIRRSG